MEVVMKVLVVGGTGTIGRMVINALKDRHDLIIAGKSNGEVKVDVRDFSSVETMYKSIGKIDAVVSTIGKVHFGPLTEMQPKEYFVGLNDKLMGQINLVLAGLNHLNDKGSFTLTSGILNSEPIRYGSSAAMVNGAIDGFVVGAAIEMPRGIRINAISPTVLEESMDIYGDYFPGFQPAPGPRVAQVFRKSIEGAQTGQIYRVW
jgi:NAD(P)-dependent dehydrogenase (short-subunit alcohol dehydrogenase family)